jgi:hypothetical protein
MTDATHRQVRELSSCPLELVHCEDILLTVFAAQGFNDSRSSTGRQLNEEAL